MKAAPLLVAWHNDSAPIYSVHFQPTGKARLATAGGDNNVRVEENDDHHRVTYLSTLVRHSQAVNVVRWCPKGDMLASAGDDGNVLLWVPLDHNAPVAALGDDHADDKESWHVKRMCRSPSEREIYDLAWSPDGAFFIIGSMDNVARIFDASTGTIVRQVAEHNHYVQGVAWDPLNEFLATQSSDRSVHVYALKTNDGQFSLQQHGRIAKMDLPARRRRLSNSPAPPETGTRGRLTSDASTRAHSPVPSMPGTPASLPVAMPPPTSHSRRSSLSNRSPSIRRSASPAPTMPLPAVMPSASPNPHVGLGVKNANLYASESLTSFFRRLTFAPDGSLLFTPAGQYKTSNAPNADQSKVTDEVINTCYIYSRGGLNKPPIAHLPGHKKPSIAVRCSPVLYTLRLPVDTQHITVDTSAASEGNIPPLPEAAHPHRRAPSDDLDDRIKDMTAKTTGQDHESSATTGGPQPAFSLPYRMVYAVATQDAVYVYDTQQQTPLCVVSNLHYATFTDMTWSNDGLTLLMSSSDGFASSISFGAEELGKIHQGTLNTRIAQPTALNLGLQTSVHSSPGHTPTQPNAPSTVSGAAPKQTPPFFAPSPSPLSAARPASPTRSNSASSITTQSSFAQQVPQSAQIGIVNNPTPVFGKLPSVAAVQPSSVGGLPPPLTSPTPPMTPLATGTADMANNGASGTFAVPGGRSSVPPVSDSDKNSSFSQATKRDANGDHQDSRESKKRRVAPTLISGNDRGPG